MITAPVVACMREKDGLESDNTNDVLSSLNKAVVDKNEQVSVAVPSDDGRTN
jgi:hypothetical protein